MQVFKKRQGFPSNSHYQEKTATKLSNHRNQEYAEVM